MFEILKNSKRIQINDYREWVPGKDENGGSYAYYYEFENVGNGFVVRYRTSAEFEYCEKFGNFQSCQRCMYTNWNGDVWSCSAPDEVWSLRDILKFIENNIDKDFEVFVDGYKLE
jgi:hypothetical protein